MRSPPRKTNTAAYCVLPFAFCSGGAVVPRWCGSRKPSEGPKALAFGPFDWRERVGARVPAVTQPLSVVFPSVPEDRMFAERLQRQREAYCSSEFWQPHGSQDPSRSHVVSDMSISERTHPSQANHPTGSTSSPSFVRGSRMRPTHPVPHTHTHTASTPRARCNPT